MLSHSSPSLESRLVAGLRLGLLSALMACSTTTTYVADRCDVNLLSLSPVEAAPGATVTLQGGPLTRDWDTIVLVGGQSADIEGVDREGCTECDSCRSAASCNACDDCDDCDAQCAALCVETVRFVVPALAPGAASVRVLNGHGGSDVAELLVLEAPVDSGGADTAPPSDTGAPADTGAGADTAAPAPPPALGVCL